MAKQTLQFLRSAVPSKKPTISQIELGELSMNTFDGRLFMRKSGSSGESIASFVSYEELTGSFLSITGSLQGTASFATTASYVIGQSATASYALTASYADNFTVGNTLTAQRIVVQTVSSSIVFSSGSNRFGNSLANTQTMTGSVGITGSLLLNGGSLAVQDGTILYHTFSWFTPSSSVSTSGTTVTSVGTQFTSAMVDAKLTISGEGRIITAFTSNTQVTVNSAYSQNYSAITASNWGVFSRAIHIDSSGSRSHYNTLGVLQQSNNYFPQNVSATSYSSNANQSYFFDGGLYTNASGAVTWGSGTTANTSTTARDLGIRRNTSGSLEIYDGATADGTLTNRRDLLVRNITGSNASFSSSVSANSFTDGFITISAAQINRTGGAVELQYGGSSNVRIFGAGSNPTVFNSSTGNVQIGTTSADNGAKLQVSGSITAASALARGVSILPTLVASANSDVLVGLDITPTFNTGSFTGVQTYGLRVTGNSSFTIPSIGNLVIQSAGNQPGISFNQSGGAERGSIKINGGSQEQFNFISNVATGTFIWFTNTSTQIAKLFSTGNFTLQNGGTFTDNGATLQVNGTNTASASLARGVTITNTLSASANGDTLVGLDINPTFTNGSFTGVTQRFASFSIAGSNKGAIKWDYTNSILELNSTGRLDLTAGSGYQMFFNASSAIFQSSLNVNRTGFASSTATQAGSNALVFQSSLWDGTSQVFFYTSFKSLASTTVNQLSRFSLFANTTSTGGGGTEYLSLFNNTGNFTLQNGGTFTDNGYRLQVNGSGSASGSLFVTGSSMFSGSVVQSGSLTSYGPNTFVGNTTITGSVDIAGSLSTTGTLTAQTLVVQTVSSSVVYASGSNVFGNSLANTQTMTGSVAITGSLTMAGNILPISDNTITLGKANFDYNNVWTRKVRSSGNLEFQTDIYKFYSGTTFTEILRINAYSGSFIFQNGGTFTDNGATLQVNGTNIASASLARGVTITNTLSASANSDVLVGLDINPTFNTGSFTGVTNLSARITGTLSVIGSILQNGSTLAVQDNTILYHNTKWFTPSSTISTSGTSVTSVGTQFTSAMVGSKLTISGESKLITVFTSNTQVTVASAYSQNYSGVASGSWGVYSISFRNYELKGTVEYYNAQYTPQGILSFSTQKNSGGGTNNVIGNQDSSAYTFADQWTFVKGILRPLDGINLGNVSTSYGEGGTNFEGYSSAGINYFQINTSGLTRLKVNTTGNISIGTTTDAGYRLDVVGTTRFQGTTASDTAPLGSELAAVTGTGTNWALAGGATNLNVGGYTHTTGSVVPLTTSLAAVNGTYYQITYTITGRTAGSITIDYGGTSTTFIAATGATGPLASSTAVLTITPTTDFDGTVVLSIKTISNSSASSTFANSSGSANIEIRANSSTNNTFIGINAGRRNTTGNFNAFFGTNAGLNNTTGASNTFIGIGAGYNNSIANNNSFIGLNAGVANTTGGSNTFIGASAGSNNTTGANNSFIGYQAGTNNTTGTNNVFLGFSAGISNSTGTGNVSIGFESARNNTTGVNNVFIGLYAGYSNTTGDNNLFVGRGAAFSNTTGGNNVFLGLSAGRFIANGSTANTIANTSIYIGNNTKALADNQTNQIVIGDNTTGLGSNTTVLGNSSTVTTAIYGDLILGSTVDNGSDKLQVSGSTRLNGTTTIVSASLDYQQNLAVATGSFQTIVSAATGSFRSAFFDYVAYSGSVVRAGTVISTWSGSVTEYFENYTNDLGGSTSVVTLQTAISGSNIQLQAGISGSAWSVRSLVRLL